MSFLHLAESFLVVGANLGRAFQSRSQTTTADLLTFAGIALAVVAILAGLAAWDRHRKRSVARTDAELILFRRLCRLHALTAADTHLLTQLAESRSPRLRSVLFVDPSFLDDAAQGGGQQADRYAQIRRVLFGDA
ncbi:MAG: hypothetical protein ACE5KM_08715 [Planctomycetaceae bacterium]